MRKVRNAILAWLAAAALAIGHHGLAAFDTTTTINVKGTVTEFHFVNPHCVVEFEVKDDKGKVEKWQGEMTSPAHLKGWTATSLEPGNVVTVSGYRAKSGAYYMWITKLSSSNGTELKSFSGN
jgi:uncharacterized protein DUF6152